MSGHFLIVEARFYDEIADAQVAGAERVLKKAGASWERISVPGALEIPAAIAFYLQELFQNLFQVFSKISNLSHHLI